MLPRLALSAAVLVAAAMAIDSTQFADDLEQCIRQAAHEAASSFQQWGDGCLPRTEKVDVQAAVLAKSITPFEKKYGYQAALWCNFYSTRMNEKLDPNNPQPNNPNYGDWYWSLLCPWPLDQCGNEPMGLHGDEHHGVPIEWSTTQNWKYLGEQRRTMSCGLCGRLRDRLGDAPFTQPLAKVNDPGRENWYGNVWDMHPFGAWLANERHKQGWDLAETVDKISKYRASNGEEIHGFAWQSTRLLAVDAQGKRKETIEFKAAPVHARKICERMWHLSDQSRDDCWHGVGHGMFYYYMDIGLAMKACWSDEIMRTAPDYIGAKALLKARWLCVSGIYHSAGNSVSVSAYHLIAAEGLLAEEWLCKQYPEWQEDDAYFARCGAGLGMEEVEYMKWMVTEGNACPVDGRKHHRTDDDGKALPVAPWEKKLAGLHTVMQRTCNPATQFGTAHDECPAAFMAHFPCKKERADYNHCMSGHHLGCKDFWVMRTTFLCDNPGPRKGVNRVLHGQEHVGVWGGECTCPDGSVFLVGDEMNECGSLACHNGLAGQCHKEPNNEWAFREVHCAPGSPPSPPAPPLEALATTSIDRKFNMLLGALKAAADELAEPLH